MIKEVFVYMEKSYSQFLSTSDLLTFLSVTFMGIFSFQAFSFFQNFRCYWWDFFNVKWEYVQMVFYAKRKPAL